MLMDWWLLLVIGLGLLAGVRLGVAVRKAKRPAGDLPVAGDRPVVMLHVNDMTYDLSDTGVRSDDPDGIICWAFTAPHHVFLDDVSSGHISVPVLPPRTRISVLMASRD